MELYDKDDTCVSLIADLTKVSNSFHSKLYACPTWEEQRREYGEELLSYIPSIFSQNAQRILEAPLIEEELTKAV